ncbi:MAG: GNAT family N-acetyltransferase [Firmicutes bacterium]|nr:GNAT family N-acetyltransferase [Bacillota bacterium]MBQ3198915.1 GNAT family N-acetyltransferase [Bacillota bacterium]
MEVLKARKADLDSIEKIYGHIHDGEEQGLTTTGWLRNIYPTRETAEAALDRGDLFVMSDCGKIVAAAVINQIQVREYAEAAWRHKAADREVMVLHCLAVEPLEKGKGYGRKFVAFYEDYAKQHGCTVLRMDTNELNTVARNLYRLLGYEEIGVVSCVFNGIPDVRLVCLEKYLG